MSSSNALKLVVTHRSIEEAEKLISSMRNLGVPVRPKRPENLEELRKFLDDQSIDVIVIPGKEGYFSLAEAMEAINTSGMDVGVVLSMEKPDKKLIMDAHQAGVAHLAYASIEGYVERMVADAAEALFNRRELRQMNAKLKESEKRCDSLIDSSREPIAYIHEGMYIRANEAYLEEFGYDSFEDLEPMPVLDMIAPSHADAFKALLKSVSKDEPLPETFEVKARKSDGSEFDAVLVFARANYEGESCIQMMIRQQMAIDSELLAQMSELRDQDQVSGLFSRSYFLGKLDEAVSAAMDGKKNQALLLLEIDNFGAIEKEIGMLQTDELIKAAGGRIKNNVPEGTTAARLSDDSFAISLTESDHDSTLSFAEKIVAAFKERIFELSSKSMSISASVGAVQMGQRNADTNQLLDKAEECLRQAKMAGGNQVSYFDPGAQDRAEIERQEALINKIKMAIEEDNMLLHFQPIISLQGGGSPFYECLLRMKGEQEESVLPENFLPIALEHGLGRMIDRWVIQRAIASLSVKKRGGEKVRLMAKLSNASLNDDGLADWIGNHLKQMKVPGELLVLQIKESRIFTNLAQVKALCDKLAAHGVLVCIDGFGVGLDPFELLKHIDAKLLKLDPTLTENLSSEEEQRERLQGIMEKVKELKRLTIASEVTEAGTMTQLFANQVDFVMGFFIAEAAPNMNYDFS